MSPATVAIFAFGCVNAATDQPAPLGYRTDGRGDLVFRRMGYVARPPSRRRLFRYPFSLGAKELFVDPNILAHTKLSALKKCARG